MSRRRQTANLGCMTSPTAGPMDIDDANAWATQTDIGREFGWTAVQLGHCLFLTGLRMDREPTAAAKEAGLIHTLDKANGAGQPYTQTLWHVDAVTTRVRDYIRLVGSLQGVTDIIGSLSTKPAKKAKPTVAELAEHLEALSQRVEILEYSQAAIAS